MAAGVNVDQILAALSQPLEENASSQIPGFDALSPPSKTEVTTAVRLLRYSTFLFINLFESDLKNEYLPISLRSHMSAHKVARRVPITIDQFAFELGISEDEIESSKNDQLNVTWSTATGDSIIHGLMSKAVRLFMLWMGLPLALPLYAMTYCLASSCDVWLTLLSETHIAYPGAKSEPATVIEAVQGAEGSTPAETLRFFAANTNQLLSTFLRAVASAAGTNFNAIFPQDLPVLLAEDFSTLTTPLLTPKPPMQAQVSSLLTSKPLLSDAPTNFAASTHTQWFKVAEYHFDKVNLPFQALETGDVASELKWHQFSSEVLRKRASCIALSERQVIEHLARPIHRNTMLHKVYSTCLENDKCTVSDFLTAVRDFYFPNGQFRIHVERGWTQLRVGSIAEFNDLLHHIRMYFQLIFTEYAWMRGQMTRHDFARHLFDKLQHLVTECHSTLAKTIQKFFPLAELLDKFSIHLDQTMLWSPERVESEATAFVQWSMERLQKAKMAANTANLYKTTATTLTSSIDFASSVKPKPARAQPTSLVSQGGSYASRGRGRGRGRGYDRSHSSGRGWSQQRAVQTASVQFSSPATTGLPPPPHGRASSIAGGRDLRVFHDMKPGKLSKEQKEQYIEQFLKSPIPETDEAKSMIIHERSAPLGQTLHGLAAALRDQGERVGFIPDPIGISFQLVLAYHFHNPSCCFVCNSKQSPPGDRMHSVAECPTANRLLPRAQIEEFLRHPANADKGWRLKRTMPTILGFPPKQPSQAKEPRRWDRPPSSSASRKLPRTDPASSHVR
jgi:hypothetical protein